MLSWEAVQAFITCNSYGLVSRRTTHLRTEDPHLLMMLLNRKSALSGWQIFSKNRLRFIISIQAGSRWELASDPMNILNSNLSIQPRYWDDGWSHQVKLTVKFAPDIIKYYHHPTIWPPLLCPAMSSFQPGVTKYYINTGTGLVSATHCTGGDHSACYWPNMLLQHHSVHLRSLSQRNASLLFKLSHTLLTGRVGPGFTKP